MVKFTTEKPDRNRLVSVAIAVKIFFFQSTLFFRLFSVFAFSAVMKPKSVVSDFATDFFDPGIPLVVTVEQEI